MNNETIRTGEDTIHLENGTTVEFKGYYLHNKPYYGKIKKYKNNELIMEGGFTCLNGNPTYDENNYNGEIKEYEDGKILHKGRYRYEGAGGIVLPEGEHVYYHDNGRVKRIEPYNKYGKLSGVMQKYDRDGKLEFEGKLIDGQGSGIYYNNDYNDKRKWYEGGIVFSEGSRTRLGNNFFDSHYIDDVYPSGYGKQYNRDGKLKFEGKYSYGRRNGYGKAYDGNGNLILEGEFINNHFTNGYLKEYDDIGNVIKEGEYKNGRFNGRIKHYSSRTGKLIFEGEGTKMDFLFTGRVKKYNDNGNLTFEGTYVDDKRNGYGKAYDGNGNLIFEGAYLENRSYDGKRYTYNSEGQLIKTETIENGEVVQQTNYISNENKINLGSQNNGLGKK